jgi:hypothetical protein
MELQVILAFTDADRWRPGIGDPSFMGWLTVAAYLYAAFICRKAGIFARLRGDLGAHRFWGMLAILLLGLGINKQLDLQTFFTLAGKQAAQAQGWYESRRIVQGIFIVFVIAAAALGLHWAWRRIRHRIAELWFPLAGFALLLSFVVIRAASFHHVDQLLHFKMAGLKVNWILELGGIALVALGARAHLPGRAARSRRTQRPRARLA